MLNVHLSYKPHISCRILFQYGVIPSKFSHQVKFRALVIPGRGFCKGIIIQDVLAPTGVLTNEQSKFIKSVFNGSFYPYNHTEE